MYEPIIMHLGTGCMARYNLEHESVPRNYITDVITPLWQQYEPWATNEEIRQTVSKKPGRMIDLALDMHGNVCGFYIFRIFQYGSWKVMFRGNAISVANIRAGVQSLKSAVKQYSPDRIIAFTSQERVYALLSHFGQILPSKNSSLSKQEWLLLSKLAGRAYTVDPHTLLVCSFYNGQHTRQGDPVGDECVHYMFSQLGYRDAYALIVRC